MHALIRHQQEYPQCKRYMCELLRHEAIPTPLLSPVLEKSTLLARNNRHEIYRSNDGKQLIKLRPDVDPNKQLITIQHYEPNFGNAEALLGLFHKPNSSKPVVNFTRHLIKQFIKLIHTLHLSGWYHNDIKPANILICPLNEKAWKPFQSTSEAIFNYQKQQAQSLDSTKPYCLFTHSLLTLDNDHDPLSIDEKNCRDKLIKIILLKQQYRLKLCDFEFASESAVRDKVYGTPVYLSPHQLDCYETKSCITSNNPSCDLYSLGIIILKVLAFSDWMTYEKLLSRSENSFERNGTIVELKMKVQNKVKHASLIKLVTLCMELTSSDPSARLSAFMQYHTKYSSRLLNKLCCCIKNHNRPLYASPLLETKSTNSL